MTRCLRAVWRRNCPEKARYLLRSASGFEEGGGCIRKRAAISGPETGSRGPRRNRLSTRQIGRTPGSGETVAGMTPHTADITDRP